MGRSREQRRLVAACAVIAALAANACAFPAAAAQNSAQRSIMTTNDAEAGDAYQFEFTSIEGEKLPLAEWRGRPVLVVNTASFCGYTPQYRDLEALYRQYQARGLVVLGVPSNDFGEQEPGTAAGIKKFCETNYQVEFPPTQENPGVRRAAPPV